VKPTAPLPQQALSSAGVGANDNAAVASAASRLIKALQQGRAKPKKMRSILAIQMEQRRRYGWAQESTERVGLTAGRPLFRASKARLS
jgi:hypothetical protein